MDREIREKLIDSKNGYAEIICHTKKLDKKYNKIKQH